MANLIAFYGAFVLYFGAAAAYRLRKTAAPALARAGFVLNLAAVGARAARSGRLPLSNSYEFILLFALAAVLLFLFFAGRDKNQAAGGIFFSLVTLLFLFVILFTRGQITAIQPLPPALRSLWLVSHVLTAVIAYGCFLVAAAFAAICLRGSGTEKPEEKQARRVYRVVLFGFAALSVSVALGAVWAEQAWGSYWTWDPKETWALVTWIVYAIYLHIGRRRILSDQALYIMVCAGFILVLFTFFGVNFLLPGLHSYA
jgi:ABC-type transport system involved in cytochrome c biogenesis permease subunit